MQVKPYRVGDGKRFATLQEATQHASRVHARTGNIIAVEYRPRNKDETFEQQAKAYAAKRWCWVDDSFIAELLADSPPQSDETPEQWVDAMAARFDLTDPRDVGL